jgi:hypothetical protein
MVARSILKCSEVRVAAALADLLAVTWCPGSILTTARRAADGINIADGARLRRQRLIPF